MTEMVTSGSMSGEEKRRDGLLGESDNERRRSQQAPPVLYATALVLDSTFRGVEPADMYCGSERCERRVSGVSGETESEGRKPRQLTELPHATDRSRDEVSRAVELFAEQHMSDGITESDKVVLKNQGRRRASPTASPQ